MKTIVREETTAPRCEVQWPETDHAFCNNPDPFLLVSAVHAGVTLYVCQECLDRLSNSPGGGIEQVEGEPPVLTFKPGQN